MTLSSGSVVRAITGLAGLRYYAWLRKSSPMSRSWRIVLPGFVAKERFSLTIGVTQGSLIFVLFRISPVRNVVRSVGMSLGRSQISRFSVNDMLCSFA